jgi:hypothetical protein
MAEIKSAIEIAMERTKSLRLSSAEKEQLKEEEMQSRAHGLANRFLEVDPHFREVEKELAKFSPEERSQVEKTMLADFAEAMNLDRNNDLIFQGIDILAPEKHALLFKAKELVGEYRTHREKERQKIEKALRRKLEEQGITGAAVLPKVEGSQEWAEALSGLRMPYEKNLKDLSEGLRK